MSRQAAHIGLEFVDAPPPPQRQPRRADLTMPLEPKRPRLRLVPDDYVAPDSHRPHGTRAKYVVEKCRCKPCRAVAIEYERRRQRAISRPDETWIGRQLTGNPNCRSLQLHRTAVFGRTARAVELLHQRLEGVAPGDVDAQRHTRWDKP